MNNKQREVLRGVIKDLSATQENINTICYQHEDSLSNLPENLESSEMYTKIENAYDNLSEASEAIGEALDYINEAMQ